MYLDENGDPIENPEYLNDYGELPGDPRARIHPEVVPESAPTSWGEAMFPRASAARASGDPWYSPRVGLGSILDQLSLPGRAFASIARPGGESYQAALGRLSAPELIPQSGDRLGTADDGSKLLRVECQWRDEYADRALRYYAGGELDQYFMFHIRKIGDAYIHNLVVAALEYPDGRVVELEDVEDDWLGRRLNWLEQSVKPAIQRLAAADYYSALAWLESVKRVIIEQAAENDSDERS